MKIKVGGILDLSTIDYPRKLASVIFLYGCNFRCPFCFNPNLIYGNNYEEKEINELINLIKNKSFADAVVITGGEPTIQEKELKELCKKLKENKFLVKIDTNGSNPSLIKELIENKFVDYIALDVKGPLNEKDYSKIIGVNSKNFIKDVKETINIILNSNMDYEFRSPIIPMLNDKEDLLKKHADDVKDSKTFVLEQFDPENGTLDPKFKDLQPLPEKKMNEIAKLFKNKIIKTRTKQGERIISNRIVDR